MIFKGIPNQYVRFSSKTVIRVTGKKGFYFNENGKYETDNDLLCRILKQHFEIENSNEENSITDDKPTDTINIKHCKKCDFICENQGQLLAHYREAHPKEG